MDQKTIDHILLKYQQGTATEEELAALEQLADKLLSAQEAEVFKSDLEKFEIKNEIRKKITLPSSQKFNWLKVAASVALLVGLSVTSWFVYQSANAPEMILVSTSFGEQKTIVLPDGSEVLINAMSSLEYPKIFGQEGREVSLKGEALFQVTKDPNRPFVVESNGLNTSVLGTTFNVSAYEDDSLFQVSLVEGSVRVSDGETDRLLIPGEQASYHTVSSELIKSNFDTSAVLAWRNREIVLSNTSFRQIQKIVERRFGVSLRFSDPEIAQFKVSGRFTDSDLNLFLSTICAAKSIEYTFNKENEVVLSIQ